MPTRYEKEKTERERSEMPTLRSFSSQLEGIDDDPDGPDDKFG
jgi:hypothetical protein